MIDSIILIRTSITALCKLMIVLGKSALFSWVISAEPGKIGIIESFQEAVWFLGWLFFGDQHPVNCHPNAAFRTMQTPAEINDVPIACNITWQGARFVSIAALQLAVEHAHPQQLVWFYLDPFGKCWCQGRGQDVLCIATVVFIPAWSPEAGMELGLGMGKCVVIPSLSPDQQKDISIACF